MNVHIGSHFEICSSLNLVKYFFPQNVEGCMLRWPRSVLCKPSSQRACVGIKMFCTHRHGGHQAGGSLYGVLVREPCLFPHLCSCGSMGPFCCLTTYRTNVSFFSSELQKESHSQHSFDWRAFLSILSTCHTRSHNM